MINLTDRPVSIVNEEKLIAAVSASLAWAISEFCALPATSTFSDKHKKIFSMEFSRERAKRPLDQEFLNTAFAWSHTDERHLGNALILDKLREYYPLDGLLVHAYSTCKRGLKMMFVHLWSTGMVMLPSTFLSGSYFPYEIFDNSLMNWLRITSREGGAGNKRSAEWRLKNYGHRILWLTSWRQPKDFSLNELAELQNASTSSIKGNHNYEISGSVLPCIDLAYRALIDFGDEISYSFDDYEKYQSWSNLPAEIRGAAGDFDNRRPPRVKKNYPKKKRSGGSNKNSLGITADKSLRLAHHNKICLHMAKKMRLPASRWKSELPIDYVGRNHVDTTKIMANWRRAMLDFTQTRRMEGLLSEKMVNSGLCFLTDYLCLYLPWWIEQFNSNIKVPLSPREFNRYLFVHRDEKKSLDELPLTFVEFVQLRRTSASTVNSVIRLICSLFRSVATSFGDDSVIAGPGYRVPMSEEFDLLPERTNLNKSSKNVIPRGIYPHLIKFAHGVEDFGCYLLAQALAGEIDVKLASSLPRFDCGKWGYIPFYYHRGKQIYIKSVPNVFNWIERELVEGRAAVLPHSSGHRINTSILETGLRGQSVQWLDRDTFDYLNEGASEGEKTYELYVNTDKTRSSYPTVIIHRVRTLLMREKAFQKLFVEYDRQSIIKYERRDFSAQLKPLFRAGTVNNVVSDSLYSRAWQDLMVEFEFFYNSVSEQRCMPLYEIKRQFDLDGTIKIDSASQNGEMLFCPVSIAVMHTPHSARTTFITNRQGTGGLTLDEASMLVGHSGVEATGYYTKPSKEQLREAVSRMDEALFGDFVCFDSPGPGSTYIRADKSDSAFRRSFELNRAETIKVYSVQAKGVWSLSDKQRTDPSLNGLNMLKNGPMSQIIFRSTHVCPVGEVCPQEVIDHCGGEGKRCGMCPLACKSIDHIQAIAAKAHSLKISMSFIRQKIQAMEAVGESESATDELWELLARDASECAGWEMDERLLRAELERAQAEGRHASKDFLVEQPHSVTQHLTYVTRDLTTSQFMLQHLGEANVYREMLTETQLAQSTLLRKKLIASIGTEAYSQLPPAIDAVADTARMLALQLRASGKTLQHLGLETEPKLVFSENR